MDFINEILAFYYSEEFGSWVAAITGLVTAATAITALTPTKTDNTIVNAALKVLNILAGNVLKNKNADDV